MSDRIFASVCMGVCAVIVFQMWKLEVPFAYEPIGPKAFPILLAILMSLCCISIFWKPDRDIQWPERAVLGKGAILLTLLTSYGLLFETVGFPLLTMVVVTLISRLFGGGWISGSVAGVSIGVFGYLIFNNLLQVSLPAGLVWS